MKDNIIKHKNLLGYAKFEDFELRELKLLLKLIVEYQNTKDTTFSAQKIKKFINMDKKSYQEFGRIVRELGKKEIIIPENDKINIYHIFSKLTFDLKLKEIVLNYTPDFLQLIENIDNKYCKYNLKNIENLKSKYSILIYLRGRADLFKNKFTVSLDDMRKYYGKNYAVNDIDKYILSPALEEINKFTDLNISVEKMYQAQQRGRSKLVGYTFYVSKKEIPISLELQDAINKAKKNIYISKSKVLNENTIKILLDEILEEDLISGLKYAYQKINKEFTTLEYLKKVVLSKEEVSTGEVIEKKESTIDIVEPNRDTRKVDSLDEYEKLKIEEKALELLCSNEGIDTAFLLRIKEKSPNVYWSMISKYIE